MPAQVLCELAAQEMAAVKSGNIQESRLARVVSEALQGLDSFGIAHVDLAHRRSLTVKKWRRLFRALRVPQ